MRAEHCTAALPDEACGVAVELASICGRFSTTGIFLTDIYGRFSISDSRRSRPVINGYPYTYQL